MSDDHKKFNATLKQHFPNLYCTMGKGWRDGGDLLGAGIRVGKGWFEIIYDLSNKLESIIKEFPEGAVLPRAIQVKEKFGTLRFYMSSCCDGMFEAINAAEKKSGETCEWCGEKGYISRGNGWWLKTLCNECHNKRDSQTIDKK